MKTEILVTEPDGDGIYDFKHKMTPVMAKVFKVYLNKAENIELENILLGDHGNNEIEVTIFHISASKAKRLQTLQNEMLGKDA